MEGRAFWLLAAVAVGVLLMARRRAGSWRGVMRVAQSKTPRTWDAALNAVRAAPRQLAEAKRAAADFDAVFQTTFDGAAAGPAAVRLLFAHRARTRAALGDARMRLPNDLVAERALADAAERVDRAMTDHIEDARQRTGAQGLNPGPLHDDHYGRWYRAYNDVIA